MWTFSHCLLSALCLMCLASSHQFPHLRGSVVALISTHYKLGVEIRNILITLLDIWLKHPPCKVLCLCTATTLKFHWAWLWRVIKTVRHRKDLFSSFCSSDWVQPAIIIYDYNCQGRRGPCWLYNKMRTVKVVFNVPAQLVSLSGGRLEKLAGTTSPLPSSGNNFVIREIYV